LRCLQVPRCRSLLCVWLLFCHQGSNALTANTASADFFLEKNAASLSDILSSPKRYANALNMTLEQVERTKETYRTASEDLHTRLQSKDYTGTEKHTLLCGHRLEYGRHPFSCPKCWSYLPVCVCGVAGDVKRALPSNLEVVVWTHHREWGLTSNTGCLLGLTLDNCRPLMKGLPEHDNQLEDILEDEDCLAVVLWPDQNSTDPDSSSSEPKTISLNEVKEELQNRRVVLIAVDGTWRNARRMVARLPPTVPRLDLSMDVVFSHNNANDHSSGGESSILAPLRARGPKTRECAERQVCTAEAVASALMQLGLTRCDGDHVLDITRRKVDLIRRYRGKT
jgi:DTW domain-containing protein YfiP